MYVSYRVYHIVCGRPCIVLGFHLCSTASPLPTTINDSGFVEKGEKNYDTSAICCYFSLAVVVPTSLSKAVPDAVYLHSTAWGGWESFPTLGSDPCWGLDLVGSRNKNSFLFEVKTISLFKVLHRFTDILQCLVPVV
jgi:hypothetical protein